MIAFMYVLFVRIYLPLVRRKCAHSGWYCNYTHSSKATRRSRRGIQGSQQRVLSLLEAFGSGDKINR